MNKTKLTGILAFFLWLALGTAYAKRPPASKYFEDEQVAALSKAAASGRVTKVDRLIESGVNVNYQGKDGWTPLAYALMSMNKRGYQRLLEHGADPDLPIAGLPGTARWVTGFAAQGDDSFWLIQALEHGADVNYQCELSSDMTPIFFAVMNNRHENAEILIEAGADLGSLNSTGYTPLAQAISWRDFKLALKFLEAGADWTVEDSKGRAWGLLTLEEYNNNKMVLRSGEGWEDYLKILAWLRAAGAELPVGLPEPEKGQE